MRNTTLRDASFFLQNLYYLLQSSAFLYISAQFMGTFYTTGRTINRRIRMNVEWLIDVIEFNEV